MPIILTEEKKKEGMRGVGGGRGRKTCACIKAHTLVMEGMNKEEIEEGSK